MNYWVISGRRSFGQTEGFNKDSQGIQDLFSTIQSKAPNIFQGRQDS